MKSIIETAITMDVDTKAKIEMCEKNIQWAESCKLTFLTQRRLAFLLYKVETRVKSEE